MDENLWERVKSLYARASTAEPGSQAALEADPEAAVIVFRLLGADRTETRHAGAAHCLPDPWGESGHTLQPGARLLERFEILEFLGSGGTGEVYRAFDHQQSIQIAVKTLRPILAADGAAIRMLHNELNTARSVTSPYVCRLHDFHWQAGSAAPPFFTMELLQGRTLADYLAANGPLRLDLAKQLAEQIIAGLEAAHARGIIHRDLKTSNVMLTNGGSRAVIMDFGLAREWAPASAEKTFATTMFAGTPAYMAPEQLTGQRATFASDIYALGVVLFEMVTGRRPFEGGNPLETASRRLSEQPPSPRRYVPGLDRRWERAILACLERDPEKRPASVVAVRRLLDEEPPLLWNRRRILIGAGAAIPCLAAGALWWMSARPEQSVNVDVFNVENLTGDPAFDFLCQGIVTDLIRRFAESNTISVIPFRAPFKSAAANSKSRFALSGELRDHGPAQHLEIRIADRANVNARWSRTYRPAAFRDLIALQDSIATETLAQLMRSAGIRRPNAALEWVRSGFHRKPASPTSDPAAFDLYMRAIALQQEYTEGSLRAASGFLERAVARDQHFALAWASLSECSLSLLNFGFDYQSATASKARDSALRAIREDASLAEAHAAMGAINQIDWNWPAADAEFNRALALKPRFPRALRWRAGFRLQFARFDEALADLDNASRIDPYDRGEASTYGMALMYAGRLRDAIAYLTREIGDRNMLGARTNLAIALGLLAKQTGPPASADLFARAIAEVRAIEAIERTPGGTGLSDRLFALLYSMSGDLKRATPYVARVEQNVAARRVSPGTIANIYVAQHRLEDADLALERATILRDRIVLYLRVNPLLTDLRGRPRFEKLLETLRLK